MTRGERAIRTVAGIATIVAATGFPAGMALGADEERVQAASSTVMAGTEGSKTIVVESTLGGKPWVIGAGVTDQTRSEGKAKGLHEVKAGAG